MSAPEIVAPSERSSRVIARNTGWRMIAFGGRTVGGLVATVLVARLEGPNGLGRFQFAMTLTLLLSFLVQLGLQKLLVRELARRPEKTQASLDTAVAVSIVGGLVFSAALYAVMAIVGAGASQTFLLVTAGLALTVDSVTRVELSLFWALEQMRYEAVTVVIQEAVFVLGTIIALAAGFGPEGVMVAYLASRIVGAATAWGITVRRFGYRVAPRPSREIIAPLLRKTIPFAIDDALSLAYIRADAVLLGILQGPTAVGFYNAATNLVLYLNVLPRMLNLSLYPRMSRAWPDRPEELARLRDGSLRILGAISVPITVGSFLLADKIFPFVYGSGFQEAVTCYLILVPVIPVRMLGNTLGTALTAADGQTRRTIAVSIAAVANIGMNLVAIPRWSYLGAAGVTLVTETALFLAYAEMLRRTIGPSKVVQAILIPALASIPMAIAVVSTWKMFVGIPIILGVISYAVALYAIAGLMMPALVRQPRALVVGFLKGDT